MRTSLVTVAEKDGLLRSRGRRLRAAGLLSRARVLLRGQSGNALVETAVTLPILLVLVTGIATFGIAFDNYLSLADAVGIGGRQLAISRSNTTNPCSVAATAVQNALPSGMVPGNLTFTLVLNGVQYGPYAGAANTSCSSASNSTGAAGNLVQGQNAQLTVSYPCNLSIYGKNYAPTCNLTSQVTELVQ